MLQSEEKSEVGLLTQPVAQSAQIDRLDCSMQGQVLLVLLLGPQEVEGVRDPFLQVHFYICKALILFMRASPSQSSQPQISTSESITTEDFNS